MLSCCSFRSFGANLKRLVSPGATFKETQTVLPHMTTNRTGKPGDDIFCTPMMIEQMYDIVLRNVACKARVKRVVCTHKAPLALGGSYVLEGEATDVNQDTATFRVVCKSVGAKPRVLGDATITIESL